MGTALYLAQHQVPKKIFGFDSFQGFDSSVLTDISLGGPDLKEYKRIGGFDDTSLKLLCKRINALDLAEVVTLVPGYFTETLPTCDGERFSFVYLDCDLYDSCKECLAFFYPRMPSGGVFLFDEYEDPVFPGCKLAVDEFFADRTEVPVPIEIGNAVRWSVRKI